MQMATRIQHISFITPLINMEQMAALLFMARGHLFNQYTRPDGQEWDLTKSPKHVQIPCTDTILLTLSLFDARSKQYNNWPELLLTHHEHTERHQVTEHLTPDGEMFTEIVPLRALPYVPFHRITTSILDSIYLHKCILPDGRIDYSGTTTPYGEDIQIETSTGEPIEKSILSDVSQWIQLDKTTFLDAKPSFEYKNLPHGPICFQDELIASRVDADTLKLLVCKSVWAKRRVVYELVFHLAPLWLHWMTKPVKAVKITQTIIPQFDFCYELSSSDDDVEEIEDSDAENYVGKRRRQEKKEKE